jgi:hypothetical protein
MSKEAGPLAAFGSCGAVRAFVGGPSQQQLEQSLPMPPTVSGFSDWRLEWDR